MLESGIGYRFIMKNQEKEQMPKKDWAYPDEILGPASEHPRKFSGTFGYCVPFGLMMLVQRSFPLRLFSQ
jgi:hypothetical protein